MDPKFQSSFIPKGPVVSSGIANLSNKEKGRGLFGFLATIVFLLSIVVALGVFGYNLYLSSNITKMGNDLADARTKLDPDTINQISRLNSRIISTQTLLAQHTVLSPFFDFLESTTLKSLRWTGFSYASAKGGLTLIMQGQAKGYEALALQAQIFNQSKYIKNPLFTNLTLDDKGNVTFAFSATLDPSVVSYKNALVNSLVIPTIASSTPVITKTATSTATSTTTSAPKTASSTVNKK